MSRTKAKSLKEDKRYKDAPRYKVIYGYEDYFKSQYNNVLKFMVKEMSLKMKSFIK